MSAPAAGVIERLAGWGRRLATTGGAPATLSVPLLIGALGVGAETAVVIELHWRAQMAADAAAVAAANRLARGESGKAEGAAQRAARRIGRSGPNVPVSVTVRPPAAGSTTVEVTVERYYVPLVARYVVSGGVPVAARAVAQVVAADGDCVVRLVRPASAQTTVVSACAMETAQTLVPPTSTASKPN